MSSEPGSGSYRRLITYLGLVKPINGRPRSAWARIANVGQDSSRIEVAAGIVLSLVLIGVVSLRIFADPVWFRLIAGFACLVFVGNLIRVFALAVRRR